jgi:hypothetical protein
VLTGKRFRLERATLALGVANGKRNAVTVPAGAILKVVSGPSGDGDRMVDVHWEGQTLTLFAIDVDGSGRSVAVAQTSGPPT